MSDAEAMPFGCPVCERKFVWKKQLAGKRVKCKCGHSIQVPGSAIATPPRSIRHTTNESQLYDFADDELPPPPAAISQIPACVIPARVIPASVNRTPARPLAYQRGPTPREKDRFSQANLISLPRDVYIPIVLLTAGMLLYAAYFISAYRLSDRAAEFAFLGVGLITLFKTLLLVGFALVIAGPVGVSFGGLWTAILKLASVAVFCDGAASWVDYAIQGNGAHRTAGPFGFGIIGFPVAILIYWTLYQFLFSMDAHESWIVVRFLSIFDRLIRYGLFFMLLNVFVHKTATTGANTSVIGSPVSGVVVNTAGDPLSAHVLDLKRSGSLNEARAYIAHGHEKALGKTVDDWYAAGCPNVWFEMSHPDINDRRNALDVIVELPDDKAARAKCFDVMSAYYESVGLQTKAATMNDSAMESARDSGQAFLRVRMR